MTGKPEPDVKALLKPYREELDRCDQVLLDCLRDRMRIIDEISQIKHANDIAVMQQDRVNQIQEKVGRFAEENGLSPQFVQKIYSEIIAEACRIEEFVMAKLRDT